MTINSVICRSSTRHSLSHQLLTVCVDYIFSSCGLIFLSIQIHINLIRCVCQSSGSSRKLSRDVRCYHALRTMEKAYRHLVNLLLVNWVDPYRDEPDVPVDPRGRSTGITKDLDIIDIGSLSKCHKYLGTWKYFNFLSCSMTCTNLNHFSCRPA